MIVNSAEFLWMFPLLFGLFLGLQAWRRRPPRSLNIFLLVASYALFWYYNKGMTAVLAAVTLVTYLGALATERYGKRAIAPTVILLALLPLAAFKYWNFIKGNLDALFPTVHLPGLNWAIPLGISFFTLQAVGYYHDVACKKIRAERNILDYALFVSFFPQIASGPISRARDLLPQIKADRRFDPAQATQGLKWILWGAFLKMVVADNIGAAIAGPLAHSASYAAWSVSLSVVLYSIHIYCDFAGYSFMALGIGELLGFELVNNFRRPYLAVSVTDFWHRWHISLSTWLKEHIYIPLGGSRCPKWRNYLNILVTFLVSGLWHGASLGRHARRRTGGGEAPRPAQVRAKRLDAPGACAAHLRRRHPRLGLFQLPHLRPGLCHHRPHVRLSRRPDHRLVLARGPGSLRHRQ